MGMSSGASTLVRAGIGALAALLVAAPLWAATFQAEQGVEPQPAVWTPREARFVYMGFTTHYSCEGLRDKVREVLLKLGARKDLKVYESGCTNPIGAPEPFPGVSIKMQVLTPAPQGSTQPVVAAHWQPVDVLAHLNTLDAAGQCELYEQLKEKLLPLFTFRNLQFAAACVPHQLSPGGLKFKVEVLVADRPAPAG